VLIRDRRDTVDLSLAVALAAITGYVDAIGFTRLFGVFPANQSGNVVLFGIALGNGSAGDSWRPALAMAGFALGVVLAYRVGRRLPDRHRRWMLLAVETLALMALAVAAGDVLHARAPMGGADEVAALALAAIAMGLQTVALGRVSGVSVSTTYQTGAIVRLSESAADAVPGSTTARDARRALVVLVIVVACYAAGAAIGALVSRHWSGALWLAAVAAAACCALAAAAPSSSAPSPSAPAG
jgi:uncharacterized membrane protein YoaK (UPF0700 family)